MSSYGNYPDGPETLLEESAGWSLVPPILFLLAGASIWLAGVNEAVFHFLNGLSSATGSTFWSCLTILGDALVLPAIVLPLILWRPRLVWGMVSAAVLVSLMGHALKYGLDVARPAAVLGLDQITVIGPILNSHAMPSGHASAVMTVAGALIPVLPRRIYRHTVLALLVLVALSRVVVGAHWPVDVAVGAALGWSCGVAGRRMWSDFAWADCLFSRVFLGALLAGAAVAMLWYDSRYAEAFPFQVALGLTSLVIVATVLGSRVLAPGGSRGRLPQVSAAHPAVIEEERGDR